MPADICPVCSEPQLVAVQPGLYECRYCKSKIVNNRILCPACRRANEIGLENCSVCGEPLTLFSTVLSRQAAGHGSQRLEQLKGQASVIKAAAEVHSQARMADLKDVDQRRINSEREASLLQHLRDQTIFKYTAIGAGVFLLLIAIISLIVLL